MRYARHRPPKNARVSTPFGRRLQLVAALEISAALWLIVLGVALFAFGSFVQAAKTDLATQLQQVTVALTATPASKNPDDAAAAIASGYLRNGISVLLFDGPQRIDLYRANRSDSQVSIRKSSRVVAPVGQLMNPGFIPRVILGMSTVFGLSSQHGRVGAIDFIVRESDVAIVSAVEPFMLPFLIAVVVVSLFGFAFARALTRQALRPLLEVQAALERFASGDLRPQQIAEDRRSSLGGLAVAYNGAIEQMQRAFAERERADASMRQFIADAGHQLRTPLTVLRGFIAILRKGELRTPADREHILETMHRQSALMGSLIDKLMLLDRWEDSAGRTSPEPIDAGVFVEDVVAPLAEARPERIVRVATGHGDLVAIDPIDLSHAITNIVDNALKYTKGEIDVAVARSFGMVQITIADAGPGMSAEDVHHAFDRFYRGSRRDVDGTGLGLAIAKRAVERAGGTLSLESSRDAGSRFTIALPMADTTKRAALTAGAT